jgi:hypothetical protein
MERQAFRGIKSGHEGDHEIAFPDAGSITQVNWDVQGCDLDEVF